MSCKLVAKAMAVVGVHIIAKQGAAVILGEGDSDGAAGSVRENGNASGQWQFAGNGVAECPEPIDYQNLGFAACKAKANSIGANAIQFYADGNYCRFKNCPDLNHIKITPYGAWKTYKNPSAGQSVQAAPTPKPSPPPTPVPKQSTTGCILSWHEGEHLGQKYTEQSTTYNSFNEAASACKAKPKDKCDAVMFYNGNKKWYMRSSSVESQKWDGTKKDKWCIVRK